MKIENLIWYGFCLLVVLLPSVLIGLSKEQSARARVVWALLAALQIPLAFLVWALATKLLDPDGGIHSYYSTLILWVLVGPFVVLWLFYRRSPRSEMQEPPVSPEQKSGLALWSLISGGASVIFFPMAIIAIVLGHLAIKKTHLEPTPSGRWMAISGLAIGYAVILFFVAAFIL